MDFPSALLLGTVQGLTEFLPISSTGHLILVRELLGLQTAYGLLVDAVLHLATALAVFLYFRRDFLRLILVAVRWCNEFARSLFQYTGIVERNALETDMQVGVDIKVHEKKDRTLLLALIFGTLPAAVLGVLFKDYVGDAARSVEVVAWALIAGSFIFLLAEWVGKRNATTEMTPRTGLRIGFFQAIALIPGMSRSGMAISGGLLFGLTREEAARFAFMLSFPIILGAGSLSAFQLTASGILAELGFSILIAAVAAFVTGWLAIHYLLKYLKNHTLGVFVVYRLALAVMILTLL